MEDINNFIFKLIGLIMGLTVFWLIGSFITFNLTWFLDSLLGRIIGIIIFLASISTAFSNSY